jgi:hypothetical protein
LQIKHRLEACANKVIFNIECFFYLKNDYLFQNQKVYEHCGTIIEKTLVAQASSLCNPFKLPGETCHTGRNRVEFISSLGDVGIVKSST